MLALDNDFIVNLRCIELRPPDHDTVLEAIDQHPQASPDERGVLPPGDLPLELHDLAHSSLLFPPRDGITKRVGVGPLLL